MRASDVVLQLARILPQYTNLFNDEFTVDSISVSGTTVIIGTTTPHNLSVGNGVNILGGRTPLTLSTFFRGGTLGTIITNEEHDFTFGKSGALSGEGSVDAIISGANESEFNGSFPIIGVPNRKTILVRMDDSGPVGSTGSIFLENGSSALQTVNGLHAVTNIVNPTIFHYEITNGSILTPRNGSEMLVRSNARISSAISREEVLDAYTKHSPNELWLFVVLEDSIASKNRQVLSDATDNIQRTNYYRQQVTQAVTLYVIFPSGVQEIAGRQSRDIAEELFRPLCRSILFKRFDSLLAVGAYNPLSFLTHGFSFYNSAYYIHQYTFEQVADITFPDTVGYDEDVAFRDINLTMGVDIGTEELTAQLNLDEEPLP